MTLLASQTGKSATSTELQTRMEQLLKQLSDLEEEKRKTASEKEDMQQDLLKQKDRMVETEREVGYYPSPLLRFQRLIEQPTQSLTRTY